MRYVKTMIEIVWNAVVRGVMGCAVIYMLGYILSTREFLELVGVNSMNFITIAVLGVPGFFLLYGLSILFLLTG